MGSPNESAAWTIAKSEGLYRIQGWGDPYFSINAAGHITVSPQGSRGGALDLFELVQVLKQRNLELPLLIRFPDILEDRIERLTAAFAKAIARYNYPGIYQGVFPIKCNQNRHLVEALVRFGEPYQFGLEVGSKPELLIGLALLEAPDALLVCNGYKDAEFIETAILAQRLGQTPIIVIEQIEEVELAISISRKLNIKPILGVRAKLNSKGLGRWEETTGDRSKFGLSIPEILCTLGCLKAAAMLDCLQLLHFSIGSQTSSITVIKEAIRESSQIYVELAKLGANMKYLDVGGGLAVDYDGSKTDSRASKNYSTQNYANDVVAYIKDACTAAKISVPTIISESGRAISAHQSVLVFDVLGTSDIHSEIPERLQADEHLIIRNLYETYTLIDADNLQEMYHDAAQFKKEAVNLFSLGYLSLTERSRVERLYWSCCHKIISMMYQLDYACDELKELEKIMASIYYINFSLFQSAPDIWAIDQQFPIMPIHRLDEEPSQRAILADVTCDSDGKIDRFIGLQAVKPLLELHALQPHEPYYLGMFFGGTYQEVMGSLHNLFGDTNVVHIKLVPHGYQVAHVVKGDTMKEVLSYVQYDAEDLIEIIRRKTERALEEKRITLQESQQLLQNYEHSLNSYTYLSPS